MGKVCSICKHPERPAIDRALLEGIPASELARRHKVSVYSMRAHRENHLFSRSEKHRGDGFYMTGLNSITVTTIDGSGSPNKAHKRRKRRR